MTAPALPSLDVRGDLRDALVPAVLRTLDASRLAEWIMTRRWFGAKGEGAPRVRVAGAVRLPWGEVGSAIVLLEVTLASGQVQRYQLPLAIRTEAGDAPLVHVRAGVARGALVEAVEDPAFRRSLGEAFAGGGARFEEDGLAFVVESVGDAPMPALGAGRVGSAEQSNTSILYGDAAILKFFRRLEPGINPDVEIGRFLATRAGFQGTPLLLGAARLEHDGASMTAAMVQRLVPGAMDGWAFALERGRAYFADHGRGAPPNTFVAEARRLGRATGELHAALATGKGVPDFAPARATPADVDAWIDAVLASVARGTRMLEDRLAAGGMPDDVVDDARNVLAGRAAYEEYVRRAGARVREHAGLRIRHHGDYHLGQVLRDAEGRFWIIDFEGEPARSLEARRATHSPLRDVAGMLRSFSYAAATIEHDVAEDASADTRERHRIRAELWERSARDAFGEAYLDAAPRDVLPDSAERIAALLALFETEKVFYELAYEANNRPAWMWIPVRGILRLPAR